MSQTKIIKCNCAHPYQDAKHGNQKRVANKAPKEKGFRCTVCGKVQAGE